MGFGVVEQQGTRYIPLAYGVIDVSKLPDLPARLLALSQQLDAVINEFTPAYSAIEEVFQGRNIKSALRSAEGRGAILLTLARHGLPIQEFSARTIKRAVVGRGAADKSQVAHMVVRQLSLRETPAEDATDALAIALCALVQPAGALGESAQATKPALKGGKADGNPLSGATRGSRRSGQRSRPRPRPPAD